MGKNPRLTVRCEYPDTGVLPQVRDYVEHDLEGDERGHERLRRSGCGHNDRTGDDAADHDAHPQVGREHELGIIVRQQVLFLADEVGDERDPSD